MSPETFVEYTEYLIAGMLAAHFAYSLCFLIIASHMIIEYEKMIFLKPEKRSHKITNTFVFLLVGTGYFVYKRLRYNWFLRKLYFALYLVGRGILSIIIFYIFSFLVHLIFSV
ncbi:hypothetical protein [Bacillus licheniformis]|uniref:hypothetical protein n=1 Tax=Bacillus licheniformis TaxID=1402 RepID=UPI0011A263D1|nr:hypothetical protein [Bacillus licheniformis]TWK59507.1 hypothetical protein CHCC20342_3775 [Bacillus licheniformis]